MIWEELETVCIPLKLKTILNQMSIMWVMNKALLA